MLLVQTEADEVVGAGQVDVICAAQAGGEAEGAASTMRSSRASHVQKV